MTAKERYRLKILEYISNWTNDFPSRTEMAVVCGVTKDTLRKHFTVDEYAEIENTGLELRKKNSAIPRAAVYKAMLKGAKDGAVPAQKEFLDRTEGKVVERHEHTGKDGKELFPTLSVEDKVLLTNISKREQKRFTEKLPDGILEVD